MILFESFIIALAWPPLPIADTVFTAELGLISYYSSL